MAGSRTLAALAVTATVALALAGCVPTEPEPAPVPPVTDSASAAPAPEPTETEDAGPVLRPGESAAANKQYFDKVGEEFYKKHNKGTARKIIDNLVDAGFLKQDMQVTPTKTSIDLVADSILFSVRIGNECLLGQNSQYSFKGIIAPLLADGGCLIGKTQPIDW